MKRDMDVVRTILLSIEERSIDADRQVFAPIGISRDQIETHIPLLIDRGLVEAKNWSTAGEKAWGLVRLTWDGCDFLETIRDDEIWKATKEGVKEAGGFSLDLMKSLAKGLVKKKIEQHTGVELDL